MVRELRGIFECLGGNGFQLVQAPKHEPPGLAHHFGVPANRVVRTEKVGSGGYTNIVQRPLKTGFPHVDAYGEARKNVALPLLIIITEGPNRNASEMPKSLRDPLWMLPTRRQEMLFGVWNTPWSLWREKKKFTVPWQRPH